MIDTLALAYIAFGVVVPVVAIAVTLVLAFAETKLS